MNKPEILSILKKIQAAPLKKMGQNFLICQKTLNKIVKTANLKKGDNVLEIGPGLGILTEKLLTRAGKVLAVEKDPKYCSYLKNRFKNQKNRQFNLVQGDILKINISKLLKKHFLKKDSRELERVDYQLVANLPYNIASKVIHLFLEIKCRPRRMVILVQKEVAEKICSEPPQMNSLALKINLIAKPSLAFLIKGDCFYPEPKVGSAAIIFEDIDPKINFEEEKIKSFLRLIKIGFASPRKTLLNNLAGGLELDKIKLKEIFGNLGEKENVRAQELTMAEWKSLHQKIISK